MHQLPLSNLTTTQNTHKEEKLISEESPGELNPLFQLAIDPSQPSRMMKLVQLHPLHTHQYGFTPQKSTTDAAMEIKNYVMEGLAGGEVIALISLDVSGAFDAAFWPSILNGLRECSCPKNLYNLTKSYFSNRTAILSCNSIQIEKEVSRGCPQGSCCGPGYWNIQYNPC